MFLELSFTICFIDFVMRVVFFLYQSNLIFF